MWSSAEGKLGRGVCPSPPSEDPTRACGFLQTPAFSQIYPAFVLLWAKMWNCLKSSMEVTKICPEGFHSHTSPCICPRSANNNIGRGFHTVIQGKYHFISSVLDDQCIFVLENSLILAGLYDLFTQFNLCLLCLPKICHQSSNSDDGNFCIQKH